MSRGSNTTTFGAGLLIITTFTGELNQFWESNMIYQKIIMIYRDKIWFCFSKKKKKLVFVI